MKEKTLITALIFLVSLILLDHLVLAEETTTYTLGEVIVSATRVKEPEVDVPAFVRIITEEDIKNSTAKNVGDLIAEAGLGHIHKYPGALTSCGLRGFRIDLFNEQKSRVLVLINGHRAGTVNLAKIPVSDIERIEIVKGPVSCLYGQAAMGGVINIITKEGKERLGISIGDEAGSWGYSKAQGELSGKKGGVDFYLTLSRSLSDDYDAKNWGRIENTSYNDETISGRLGYRLFDNHHISIGFQRWKGWKIGSPDARYQPDPDDYVNKKRDSFDIGYKTDTFDINYYLIRDKDEWHEGPTAGGWDTPNSIYLKKTDTQGASLQKAFLLGSHRIIVGGQWDRIEVYSSSTIGAPYSPNSRYDTYGAFTEGRLSLLNKRLLLTAGTRYDYFVNEILETPGIPSVKPKRENIDNVTTRGGAVYKLTESLYLKGNIGTAFRAPAPDELATDYYTEYTFWGIHYRTHYLGNPNLKPEKSISYDRGISYRKGLFKSDLTFFNTEFKDKIVSYCSESLSTQTFKFSTQTFKNVDGATLQGIEANASYNLGLALGLKLSIEPFANITYHTRYSSEDEDEIKKYGKTLLYTPKWVGAFGIRAGQDKWDVVLIANYTGDQKVEDWNPLSPTYGQAVEKGDFTVFNLKGSYRPLKNLEITGSVENLFDKAYEYVLSYPMPRRSFYTGIKASF